MLWLLWKWLTLLVCSFLGTTELVLGTLCEKVPNIKHVTLVSKELGIDKVRLFGFESESSLLYWRQIH